MKGAVAGADTWTAWEAVALRLAARFEPLAERGGFEFRQPAALQAAVPRRLRRDYTVPVHWTSWGPADGPRLLCVGGVASSAARFSFLAADMARAGWRVVCMDWVGRGRSGWLADESEYSLAVLVEQLRQQGITVPILVLTAYELPHLHATVRGVGANDLVQKPYDQEELIHRMRRLMAA